MRHSSKGVCVVIVVLMSFIGCSLSFALEPQPFESDGCSLFPDKIPFSSISWCNCCLEHDMAYWRGGTEQEREVADSVFEECVAKEMGSKTMAAIMFEGVRVGGSAHLPTWFRWGYAWEYGRGYKPVTEQEETLLKKERALYYAKGTDPICAE